MAGRREHAIPGVRMAGHKQVTSKNSHMFVSWPGKEHGVSADAPSFCCAGSPKDCLAFSPVHQVLRCILGKPKCLKQRVLGVHCEGPVRLDVGTVPCFSRSKPRYTHAPRSVACLQMGGQPLRVRKMPKVPRHPFLLALSGCHAHQHVLGQGTQTHRNTYLLDISRETQNVSPGRISWRSERGSRGSSSHE